MDRALEAGIDDVGIGMLFARCDWCFERLQRLQPVARLKKNMLAQVRTPSVCHLLNPLSVLICLYPDFPHRNGVQETGGHLALYGTFYRHSHVDP